MASTSEDVKIPLRMLINKGNDKVFFAEAESGFVDILLSFLTLPMGTIFRLLSKNYVSQPAEVGSFSNLYKSISNLDIKYFGSVECKEMLLNPRNSSEDQCRKLKLNIDDTEQPTRYFLCEDWDCSLGSNVFLSTYKTTKCKCGKPMNREIKLKDSDVYLDHGNDGVFVTEHTSFLIGDNMLFLPISDLNTSWLNFLGEKNYRVLEEKTFNIGCNELLNILKCLILSKPPLTDMFLGETEKLIVSDNVNSELGHSAIPKMDKETVPDSRKMTIKILVQKSNNKVFFAEARDDFVDFLFSFLTIPLGTVMHLLSGNTSMCGIDNFYRSVSSLDIGSPLKSQELKDRLVCPRLASHHLCSNHIFSLNEAIKPQIYCCIRPKKGRYSGYLTMTEECSCCEIIIKDPKAKDGGFVRAPAMFRVTDDLVVTPLSYISSICFLSKLQIRSSEIEEQMIEIGTEEALSILKASLSSSEALTNGLSHILKKPKQEES